MTVLYDLLMLVAGECLWILLVCWAALSGYKHAAQMQIEELNDGPS